MFRCKECGKEYDIKPQYCDDCGNDTFEEIAEVQKQPEATESFKPNIENRENEYKEAIKADIKREEIKTKTILSYLIFLGCIILSFVILFVINPKPKEDNVKTEENIENNVADIPSLDSFWNNELPKNPVIKKPKEPEITESIKKVEPQTNVEPIKSEPIKQEQKPKQVQIKTLPKAQNIQPVQKTIPQTKTVPQSQKTSQTVKTPSNKTKTQNTVQSKPVSQKTVQNTVTNQNTNQKTSQSTNKQPLWVDTSQSSTKTTSSATQPQTKTTTQASSTVNKKELSNYKSSLRNTIGKKIDFADVVGDGKCSISFKLDSSGNLINRAFQKQSTNTTLNDAVFKAVKSTPSYNPPPSSYNGETMVLTITFYNGNFEISLN